MTLVPPLWSQGSLLNDGPKRLEKSHAHVLNLFKLSVRWYFVYETFYKGLGQTSVWEERKRLLSRRRTKDSIIQLIDRFCYSKKSLILGYPTPHNNVWLNIKGNILNVNCTYFKVSEIMSFANAIQNTEGFKKCFQGLQASVRKL